MQIEKDEPLRDVLFDSESLLRVINNQDEQQIELPYYFEEVQMKEPEEEQNYNDYIQSYLHNAEDLEEMNVELSSLKQEQSNKSLLEKLTNPLAHSFDYTKQLTRHVLKSTIDTTNTVSKNLQSKLTTQLDNQPVPKKLVKTRSVLRDTAILKELAEKVTKSQKVKTGDSDEKEGQAIQESMVEMVKGMKLMAQGFKSQFEADESKMKDIQSE